MSSSDIEYVLLGSAILIGTLWVIGFHYFLKWRDRRNMIKIITELRLNRGLYPTSYEAEESYARLARHVNRVLEEAERTKH